MTTNTTISRAKAPPSMLPIIAIILACCTALMAHAKGKADEITASEIITQAHVALAEMLHAQAGIRSAEDLEAFKIKRREILTRMKALAAMAPEAAEPTDFERRELIGIAMRYRYELFPAAAQADPYLRKVPEEYHEKLRNMAAEQLPEVNALWKYITEVTTPKEENSFEIPIGSEKIDQHLSVVVSLGRREERPKLAADPSSLGTSFAEGPEYIAISVEASEEESTIILYSQMFPIPEGFDASKFQISDAVKIDRKARNLSVRIPGVQHAYKLPAERQQDDGGQPATRRKSE